MIPTYEVDRNLFARAFFQAIAIGALAATLVVHITISIFAPGDAGTFSALFNSILPVIEFMIIGMAALLIFPIAATLTWPLRNLIANRPVLAVLIAVSTGAISGYLTSFLFADHWYSSQLPGVVSGGTFGLAWAMVIRRIAVAEPSAGANS